MQLARIRCNPSDLYSNMPGAFDVILYQCHRAAVDHRDESPPCEESRESEKGLWKDRHDYSNGRVPSDPRHRGSQNRTDWSRRFRIGRRKPDVKSELTDLDKEPEAHGCNDPKTECR